MIIKSSSLKKRGPSKSYNQIISLKRNHISITRTHYQQTRPSLGPFFFHLLPHIFSYPLVVLLPCPSQPPVVSVCSSSVDVIFTTLLLEEHVALLRSCPAFKVTLHDCILHVSPLSTVQRRGPAIHHLRRPAHPSLLPTADQLHGGDTSLGRPPAWILRFAAG